MNTLDVQRSDLTLGVVGTGLMGRGIAQIAAQAGIAVRLFDARAGAAEEARAALVATFGSLAAKGKLSAAAADQSAARLQPVDALSALAGCHVVVEAIVENLDAKRELFRSLEAVVDEDCLLATNTSSLSVTAIAAACRLPARVAGFHFFSPVPLMKLVEVIDGLLTAPALSEALVELARRCGHQPVRAADTPGFIVNHAGRGYGTEALRILGEGIAGHADIDRILRGTVGFRMGPFELFDAVGLDVSHPVMESIYDQYYQEARYRPSPLTRNRVAAGLLGRKSGQGFYRYVYGRAETPEPAAPPTVPAMNIWVSRRDPRAYTRAVQALHAAGAGVDDGLRPQPDSACLVLPTGEDCTTAALAEDLDPARTVALDPLFVDPLFLSGHLTLMRNPLTRPDVRDALWAALGSMALPISVINDSPGFVAQRVVAMIVNIGCDIAQQGIATPADIDRAVTLGLAYPKGPLAMGDAIGPATVLKILDGLYAFYRDPRYRPSPWLTRRARLSVSLLTPEN
ncbi:MAG: 3-hydroxyacyl-CoA dehydrogenase [Rhodocyclaceae bacterium]|nr:3-hydroxyacyl-CoA dehydrogenase [Rhodocyclaceae bacterium]MBX3667045.1 3-hydroxyacyl-CoA dehydrogenase [Rhodocyclaceae bacterium]